ncbi:MAG: hypothetical protein LBD13_03000 [Spirochaetaceae bacterium]|jgi:methyl-accepting chemotaxis protein|nr:hypothetical protein [Spirochaetaceae bacterium]
MKPLKAPPVGAEASAVIAEALSRRIIRGVEKPEHTDTQWRVSLARLVDPVENSAPLEGIIGRLKDSARHLRETGQTMKDLAGGLETLVAVAETLSRNMDASIQSPLEAAASMEALAVVSEVLAQVPEKPVENLKEAAEILRALARCLRYPPAQP